MYYQLLKLALSITRWLAVRACQNPAPGVWRHLIADAQGDLHWNAEPQRFRVARRLTEINR